MARRVLITGIGSFTGPYIARELSLNGYEVYGLGQLAQECEAANIFLGNILDPDSLDSALKQCRPHVVIHLAAVTYVPHGDVAEIYQTNVVGTRIFLDTLARQSVVPEKIVLASSANGPESTSLLAGSRFSPRSR